MDSNVVGNDHIHYHHHHLHESIFSGCSSSYATTAHDDNIWHDEQSSYYGNLGIDFDGAVEETGGGAFADEFDHHEIEFQGFQETDIEVIAVDPEQEYADEESDEPQKLVPPPSILDFRTSLQQSGHRRIHRKSMSLPHSPIHYSFDMTGISLDDMDLLAPSTPAKSFDLPSYITADDNFEVISSLKEPSVAKTSVHSSPKAAPLRKCAISAKKMHYGEQEEADVEFEEDRADEAKTVEVEEEPERETDNPKADPTWSPEKQKLKKAPKVAKKEGKKKDAKPSPKKKKTGKVVKVRAEKTAKSEAVKSQVRAFSSAKAKAHKTASKPSPVSKLIKLDHDYCTGKRLTPSSATGNLKVPRKAIEIPILGPSAELSKPKCKVKDKVAPVKEPPPPVKLEERPRVVLQAPVEQKTEPVVEFNPILDAKRKILRRQEMKKRARMQESEPKMSNVPLLPILPLAEITGMTCEDFEKMQMEPLKVMTNTEYEEVVIVSIGCNTDLSVPPSEQSHNLLQYIDDTVGKVKALKVNSLIASIQDVVLKKTTNIGVVGISVPAVGATAPTRTPNKPEEARVRTSSIPHGEDKVIMHLKRDRRRPQCASIGVQTIDLPFFEPLKSKSEPLSRKSRSRSRSRSHRRKRSRSSSSSSCSSTSSSSSSSSDRSYCNERSRFHRYASGSSSRRSTSYSSSRSRSRESERYRRLPIQRRDPESPENRNVVYVGRLEEELSREGLKRKFWKYGLVKHVSIHYRNNGLRYGFVTFEKPEEAYNAIEKSAKDSDINIYDVSFGGRRAFCKSEYADLDGIHSYIHYHGLSYSLGPWGDSPVSVAPKTRSTESESFEDLLKSVKAKMQNAKTVRQTSP